MVYALLLLALGYVLGSLPLAQLVARTRGEDIFQIGTANPGAANVFRTVGRGMGVVVLLGDMGKGALPVLVARWAGVSPWLALAAGVAAVVGHWYPVFTRFRGGAGLASSIGVGYGMMPLATLAGNVPALVLLYFVRNTGLVAAVGTVLFFVVAVLLDRPVSLVLAVAALPVMVLIRRYLLPMLGAPRAKGSSDE